MGEGVRMGEGMRVGERDAPLRLSPFRMLRVLDSCRPPGNRIGESHHCSPHHHQVHLHLDPPLHQISSDGSFDNNMYKFDRFI